MGCQPRCLSIAAYNINDTVITVLTAVQLWAGPGP